MAEDLACGGPGGPPRLNFSSILSLGEVGIRFLSNRSTELDPTRTVSLIDQLVTPAAITYYPKQSVKKFNNGNMTAMRAAPPVLLLSHGTTLLTGEDSHIRDYWLYHGNKAVEYGIKGIIIMGAHWNVPGRKIKVAMNPDPKAQPIALVSRSKYGHYKPNADLKTGARCMEMLKAAGFEVEADLKCNWLIDTFPMIFRMFPGKCPPVTIISQNSYFEPHFHIEIGRVLRPLRKEGYLFMGSGGGVHNLYRTEWRNIIKWRDNFAQELPPEPTHLEFRQALEDVICKNGGGPAMKQGVVRLMKHPYYRDAHGTDDHYMPTCFIAGVVGEEEDRKDKGVLGAELWELRNQAETQFAFGEWP
ncbi:hypothetical protein H2200_001549 [Cladophialophora chaetospira]|uniref:Extradiol ring-cleavage dioxygenase class III enzyme subunit B domain-containing protein n=1 Tax=Cladophialophora chaetospira TaxID=386627 RepID=A0AA39CP65_9EURO|nr:hypothetical protein H2200_001549 [Cladophialophora chaetospira]